MTGHHCNGKSNGLSVREHVKLDQACNALHLLYKKHPEVASALMDELLRYTKPEKQDYLRAARRPK